VVISSCKEGVRVEGTRAGGDQDLLAEDVAGAAAAGVAVEVVAFAASRAATHSTTSKRFAGTRSAFEGAL
jgi:hypothetical protein